jgi:uncharacterized protein (DUF1330 family)
VTVYAIALVKVTNRVAYHRYRAAFTDVFSRYAETLLAADDSPVVAIPPRSSLPGLGRVR